MKKLLISFSILATTFGFSQTWSDDVATIFYNKCGQCHHNGGIAPFSLLTYNEAGPMASFIYSAVDTEQMPPWPPNNNYQQYAHDRALSSTEKTTVLNWINNGALEGNPANTPPPPVYQTGSLLGNGDLEVQIPTYMSKATASDDYVCFAIPSNLTTNKMVRAIEIVPGNPQIVHHALIYIDDNPNGSVTDTIGGDCQGPSSPTAKLLTGYTPGSTPMVLPSSSPLKLGFPMSSNSQIYIGMHYPEGSYGMYDSTKVIFHFYPDGEVGIRTLYTEMALENWSFNLPPEQITAVNDTYYVPINASIFSVFPHMHLLGKSMVVYGVEPNQDTVKLIDIPDWNFEWQDFYKLKYMQPVSIGTILHANAIFDNTSSNPNNPNNPPISVGAGLNTLDEMMIAFIQYTLYQNGDENYNMDSLLTLGIEELFANDKSNLFFTAFPNPFDNNINLYSNNVQIGDVVSVSVYDMNGKKVKDLLKNQSITENELHIVWDGTSETGSAHSGMYFVSINVNGNFLHQRIIKR